MANISEIAASNIRANERVNVLLTLLSEKLATNPGNVDAEEVNKEIRKILDVAKAIN